MKKPIPTNKESYFGFDEQFFSTTDEKGNIVFGNEVFIRVSGYSTDRIIGSPHNIIRHPDMPKCVFKIFWRIMKSGSPVGAYVKNMSADGSYYWVFAFAFPVPSGFLSIRFKPSSEIFTKAKDLYADVLKKEKSSTMDEAELYLLTNLKKLGFESYEDFMLKAIITELQAYEDKNSKDSKVQSGSDHILKRISEIRQTTSDRLNQSFSQISQFERFSSRFSEKLTSLNEEFKKLKFLSMNMNILAANMGEDAATLSTISEEFARLAGQIENQMKLFSKFTSELLIVIKNCSLSLSALKAQMNMVDFFVKESINKLTDSDNAFDGMVKNKDIFTGLFLLSITQLSKELISLKDELMNISGQLYEIQKVINGLQIIKQTGSIESARKDDLKAAFGVYLNDMTSFIAFLRVSIAELSLNRDHLHKNAVEVHESAYDIKDNISELFRLALMKGA
jgi:PAS domain S-box-containing protein